MSKEPRIVYVSREFFALANPKYEARDKPENYGGAWDKMIEHSAYETLRLKLKFAEGLVEILSGQPFDEWMGLNNKLNGKLEIEQS